MTLDKKIFFQNQDTDEIIEAVQTGRIFSTPFAAPSSLPIPLIIVDRDTDLIPYRETLHPESKISGRSWYEFRYDSIPNDWLRVIEMSGISQPEICRRRMDESRYLGTFLEPIEHAHSMEPSELVTLIHNSLLGRYCFGKRIEFLYELFIRVILAGGMPCGWIGKFPDDMRAGRYPLDGCLVATR